MPDPRFYATKAPLTFAAAVAAIGEDAAAGDGEIRRVAAPDETDLAGAAVYCDNEKSADVLAGKPYGLCLATAALAGKAGAGPVWVVKSPKLAFAILAGRLHVSLEEIPAGEGEAAISETANVHPSAIIATGAEIGPGARIGAHCYIGRGVVIGENAVIEAGCTITHAILGTGVRLLAGVRIGQDGFGFVPGGGGLVRVPQLGRAIIGDNVEIGANSTVDRGALADTVIGEGTKIDNLVQIGHNVRIGRHCVMAAQSGVSGSSVIGDGVMIGGMVGVADHLRVGDGAQLAGGAKLMRDVPAGERWGGVPARPVKEWFRETATLAKLAKKKNG